MGEFDLEALVLEVVRKHTGRSEAGAGSRFERDLGLSENGRNALFAFLVEAFSARGVNLPSRGFFLSHFRDCQTPGDVQSAIRDTLSGVKKKSTPAPRPAPTASAATPAAAHAAAPAPAPAKSSIDAKPHRAMSVPAASKKEHRAPKKAPKRKGR
jgi:hypothetical protein